MHNEIGYLKRATPNNGTPYRHPDELDLIELIRRGVSFVRRFRFVLLGTMALGLAAGLFLYFSSPKQFTTRLIVRPWFLNQTGLLSNSEEIEIIENWQRLLSKREKTQLAAALNCDTETIRHLRSLSAEEIIRTYVPNNPNGFVINVTVTDTNVLRKLQAGIVYGLNNSPYSKDKIDFRRQRDIELIDEVRREIRALDATKHLIDSMIRSKNGTQSSLLLDISRVNAESIELNEKLYGYQEDLKFLSGVQVIEGFSTGNLTRAGLAKLSFMGLASGAFLGYLLSFLTYMLRRIKVNAHPPFS